MTVRGPEVPDVLDERAARRVLVFAALGTLLSLVAFTAPISTLNVTALSLDAGVAGRTWILSSMSVGLAAALLPAGRISDDYGRRRTFVVGTAVLAVGAAASGMAQDPLVFVLARVVQGVGGGAVIASSLGMIAHVFPAGPRRAAASGVWGASLGAGIAVGPLLSALLERASTWRDAYAVLAVLALLVAVGAHRLVDESRVEDRRRLDVVGAVAASVAVATFLAALVEGRQGWLQADVVVLLVVAVLAVATFVVVERRVDSPMLDLTLFGRPAFVAATAAAMATGLGSIALFSFMSGFLGSGLGISAMTASLLLFGWSGTSVVTSLLARRIPAHVSGRVQLATGLVGVAIGQLTLVGVHDDATWRRFLPGLVLAGLASGVVNAALGREAVASVPAGRGSLGSGANNTARYVGSAVGVTIVSVIATHPRPGSPVDGLVHGWNVSVVVTACFSLLGAAVVLAARPRA